MIEIINQKLKQVRDAQKALDEMIADYGGSISLFKIGETVRIKRTGRKAKVSKVEIGYSRMTDELSLRIEYGVQILTGGKVDFKRFTEQELESYDNQ